MVDAFTLRLPCDGGALGDAWALRHDQVRPIPAARPERNAAEATEASGSRHRSPALRTTQRTGRSSTRAQAGAAVPDRSNQPEAKR
ncbi:MAG TPA: hypothetical protein DCQ98_09655, partial [Planctomycetaceae bacterium]|nr:hypothetical protein [Planctomycetaceae bacterium]